MMAMLFTFKVWDELNAEEADARTIEALDAEDAARSYGERDNDGLCDGLYVTSNGNENPQPISVRDSDGVLSRWKVCAQQSLDWRAYKNEEPEHD